MQKVIENYTRLTISSNFFWRHYLIFAVIVILGFTDLVVTITTNVCLRSRHCLTYYCWDALKMSQYLGRKGGNMLTDIYTCMHNYIVIINTILFIYLIQYDIIYIYICIYIYIYIIYLYKRNNNNNTTTRTTQARRRKQILTKTLLENLSVALKTCIDQLQLHRLYLCIYWHIYLSIYINRHMNFI